jgi:hypothetical protein
MLQCIMMVPTKERTMSAPPYEDPSRLITRALQEARRRGLDHLGQTRWAVAKVLTVRPDMTAAEAARSVEKTIADLSN